MTGSLFSDINDFITKNPVRMHFPSHKGIGDSSFVSKAYDITELGFSDNLLHPTSSIMDAQKWLSELFSSQATLVSLNGSSAAIAAAAMACVGEGDTVLLGDNSHIACYYAIIHAGATPARFLVSDHVRGACLCEVQKAIEENPGATAAIITCPTYLGCSTDLLEIIELLRKSSVISIVDEAHGGHFHFYDGLPASAMDSGADISINSGYKTLNGPTQSAFLHLGHNSPVGEGEALKWLRTVHTTSPSYPLLLDLLQSMEAMGQVHRTMEECHSHFLEVADFVSSHSMVMLNSQAAALRSGTSYDFFKMPVDFTDLGFYGPKAAKFLEADHSIYAESIGLDYILFAAGLNSRPRDYNMLMNGLGDLASQRGMENDRAVVGFRYAPTLPKSAMGMKKAMKSKYRLLDIEECEGEISSDFLSIYPPGCPIVIPGDVIDIETVNFFITHKENRTGFSNNLVKVVI
ncbi:MAG: aminotransferase class I/II-fold pyridoxal phosphate-dependent enzyme [Eubacteriaceae bacterium]|nr:aminotransferase class I/II-fold pyridoxal phosphate-dependent enzyme [Eubacteriaceae bacterium]